ncbi:MAG: CHASE domain-containing protein [Halioglobus sp.]|nr:CHASE domain-containing protein [Halioglobus sp.]
MEAPTPGNIVLTASLTLAYVLFAQVGFLASLTPYHNATLLWPPSGIALAAVLIIGRRALPGIALGALTTAFSQHLADPLPVVVAVALITCIASTLSAWVAGESLKRIGPSALENLSAKEILTGSIVMSLASLIAASGGVGSLSVTGLLPPDVFWSTLGIWWLRDFCGMLIFGPTIYILFRLVTAYRENARHGPLFVAGLVASTFGAASLVVFSLLWNAETMRILQSLEHHSSEAARKLAQVLSESQHELEAIRALLYAANSVEEDEFHRFISAHFWEQGVDSAAQGLGWAPRVTDARLWESEMRNTGQPPVRLYERDNSGRRAPVLQRDEYFPVQFIHPLDEVNQLAIGFDLGSEKLRRTALEKARDSGRVAMVAPIYLVQSQEEAPAMLIAVPIYRPDVLVDTVDSRRANLTGFASGVFFLGTLFDKAMAGNEDDVDLHFFDEAQPVGAKRYYTRLSPSRTANDATSPRPTLAGLLAVVHGIGRLEFAGHQWMVAATPGPGFIPQHRTLGPWIGLLLTLGFGIALSSVLSERISARKRIEEEQHKTLQALRNAQVANDSKTYFMAAAAHDIKQPLYALRMLVDTLGMSDKATTSVPIIQSLKRGIAQMSQHFDTLMDVGKFRDGNFSVTRSRFQLLDFAARIDIEIAPLCAKKGLAWNLDMDEVWAYTDEELLLRLFRNLLTNAVSYTDAGEVNCSAKVEGSIVKCTISDTGRGIDEHLQQAVFETFVRLEQSGIGTAGLGLGLGLSIVEKISQALELDLQMESTPGSGTRFSFHFPIAHKLGTQ